MFGYQLSLFLCDFSQFLERIDLIFKIFQRRIYQIELTSVSVNQLIFHFLLHLMINSLLNK